MSTILFIDVETPLPEHLQRRLGPKGYEILAAASLETGLDLALAHLPDLIVGQVAAGRLEGGLLQRKLGEWPATAPIPVILMADAAAQITLRGVLKEGDELLVQPVSTELLIQALEACFRKRDIRQQRAERAKGRLQSIRIEGGLQDATERQQAEAALARERDFLWALMDCIPDTIYFKDTASKFTRVNRQQARVLGLASPEEAIGKSDYDFFDHASQAFADEQVILHTRQPLVNKPEFMRTATGGHRWISSTKAAIVSATGEVVGLVGISRDIHETKLAEEALAQRAALAALTAQVGNALIQKDSPRGILQHCAEAIVARLDAAFARIWTLNEPGKVLELQASAGLYTRLDGAHARIPLGHLKIGFIAQARQPHLTNSVMEAPWLSNPAWAKREGMVAFAGYPLIFEDRLMGVLGVFARHPLSDMTMATLGSVADGIALSLDQKRTESTLRQNEQLFRLITENAADLIAVLNREGRRLYHSPSYEKTLGYTARELEQMPPMGTIHPDDRAKVAAAVQECFRTGQGGRLEYRALHKDGSCRHLESTNGVASNPEGGPESIVVASRDITERKRAEAQLELASRQAGMAEVASNVLHNVGNVLNSVNTSASVLRDRARHAAAADILKVAELLEQHRHDLAEFLGRDNRTEQLTVYLKKLAQQLTAEQENLLTELGDLTKNIDHIKDIVSMQQDYARVSGVIEPVKVADLVEDALRMHASALLRHDVQLVRDYNPDLPDITVDKHKLLQILVNLIHNAKYACDEAGRLDKQLTVRIYAREGGVGIDVADNGVGIPPENLSKIFNHGFTTRKNGHGFGLHSGALAAREMGGTLRAHSPGPGQGATFTLELPHQTKEPIT